MSIERKHVGPRLSKAVVHADKVYLAGIVADHPVPDVAAQTGQILDQIDKLLAECGSDKAKILTANIWLADARYYDEMNSVWDKWVPTGNAPARACVEAKLAHPKYWVEIQVAAVR
ncbi:MAG TPA: RidA family protein [Burkholderiales bacterium]|nr:RidA family protein [Burkholderiales bacterium]